MRSELESVVNTFVNFRAMTASNLASHRNSAACGENISRKYPKPESTWNVLAWRKAGNAEGEKGGP